MAEYIDKKAVIDVLIKRNDITFYGIQIIKRFPAADVRPVVRGKWGEEWFDHKLKIVCSECGCFADRMTDFCPNCGAKMEVDE